jgi:hypothetical protein
MSLLADEYRPLGLMSVWSNVCYTFDSSGFLLLKSQKWSFPAISEVSWTTVFLRFYWYLSTLPTWYSWYWIPNPKDHDSVKYVTCSFLHRSKAKPIASEYSDLWLQKNVSKKGDSYSLVKRYKMCNVGMPSGQCFGATITISTGMMLYIRLSKFHIYIVSHHLQLFLPKFSRDFG